MKKNYMTRTVHVFLNVGDDVLARLKDTRDMYAQVFNAHAQWAKDNKSTNINTAHKNLYRDMRDQFPWLPSAMIQIARDHAFGNVKSYNSNNPKKKWSKSLTYRARSMKYNRSTVSMNTQGKLKFSLANGKRAVAEVDIPKYFTDRYGNWEFNSASIGIDSNGKVFANLSFRTTPTALRSEGRSVGLDRGIYNIVTTSDGDNYSSRRVRGVKRRYQYNRSTLQAKVAQGSRSAKRRLKVQRGKEARFSRNELSVIVNSLNTDGVKTFVIEDLTGLYQKRLSKNFNKLKNTWSPHVFESLLRNRCELLGIGVVTIDPCYTSQKCSSCGYTDKRNRKSSQFFCLQCGYTQHSDINAAINIRDKHVSSLPACSGVGQGASQSPNDAPSIQEVEASHGPCARGN